MRVPCRPRAVQVGRGNPVPRPRIRHAQRGRSLHSKSKRIVSRRVVAVSDCHPSENTQLPRGWCCETLRATAGSIKIGLNSSISRSLAKKFQLMYPIRSRVMHAVSSFVTVSRVELLRLKPAGGRNLSLHGYGVAKMASLSVSGYRI